MRLHLASRFALETLLADLMKQVALLAHESQVPSRNGGQSPVDSQQKAKVSVLSLSAPVPQVPRSRQNGFASCCVHVGPEAAAAAGNKPDEAGKRTEVFWESAQRGLGCPAGEALGRCRRQSSARPGASPGLPVGTGAGDPSLNLPVAPERSSQLPAVI